MANHELLHIQQRDSESIRLKGLQQHLTKSNIYSTDANKDYPTHYTPEYRSKHKHNLYSNTDEEGNEHFILHIVPQHPDGLPPQVSISEAYKIFLEDLSKGRRFNYFYKQLITLRRDILIDINNRNQGLVARDLMISPVKMSTIAQMLKEMDAPQLMVTNPVA